MFATFDQRRRREFGLIVGGTLVGIGLGAAAAFVPSFLVVAGLVALLVGAWFARSIHSMLTATVLVATLLPFGTLPFKVGLTPALLELALLALYAMLVVRSLADPERTWRWGSLAPWVILLLASSFFSFIIGSNGSPDSLLLHNYFKLLLGICLFWGVQNALDSLEQARWWLRLLILAGWAAALLGIGLRFAPDTLALRFLTALAPLGYPASGRVLRYVEDDPSGFERAIGTSVDPNGFGGMMALLGAIALGQALAQRPVLGRKWLWLITASFALAVFLTSSRAALGGFMIAGLFLATVRYRQLWWLIGAGGIAGAIAIVGLGKGGDFVERIVEGIQFKDQANQMRLAEFRNAIAIMREYPVFGVGFGRAPNIDLTTGVSSVYLALGSRMGLVGLGLYILTALAFLVLTTQAARRCERSVSDAIIGLQAAILAALAVGLLDHYFFNIEFPHMGTLFWGVVGLAMVFMCEANSAQQSSSLT